MAVISQVGIVDGQVLYAEHILRIINALSALSSNDILISGNLYNTGSFYQLGTSSFTGDSVQISSSLFILPVSVSNDDSLTRLLVINPSTGRISYKNSTSLTSSANFSGSFSGSFQGDGSNLTGIVSSKWTGSTSISRQGDVSVTGSLRVTSALTSSIISASSGITGSLFGTSSWATNASQSISSSVAISSSYVISSSYAISGSYNTITNDGALVNKRNRLVVKEGLQAVDSASIDGTALEWGGAIRTNRFLDSAVLTGSSIYVGNSSPIDTFSIRARWIELVGDAASTGTPSIRILKNNGPYVNTVVVSSSLVVEQNISASFISGAFYGDGSQLTGISGGSKWTGSTTLSRLGSVVISGSLIISGSDSNFINSSITSSIISSSQFTGSLFGTSSWATNASQSISSSVAISSSFARTGNGIFSGSFSGSYVGDGSGLTGISGGSKWTGSTVISRLGNVEITGSIIISASTNYNIIGASSFTGPVTASIISGSAVTGSLFGTSSWATNASQSISSSVAISSSFSTFAISASYATSSANAISASYIDLARSASVSISSSISQTSSFARSGNGIFSGSFSGSYVGDGSGLTGISGGSSKWTGSTSISRLSDVSITGSFTVSGSDQINILGASQFTGPITASIISASSGITGSLLGTASFATTASYAYNTINPAVNSDQRYFESTDFAGTVQGDLGIFIGGTQFGGGVIFSDQYGLGTAENVLGVYRIFTGTSTSGSGWMYKGYSGGFGNAYLFGRGNALTGRWRIAISSSLSSSNNDIWTASLGFMDNGTNNSYGAYFRWSPAENSGKWRAILQKGLTSSSLDTGVVPNTSYSIFQIESNASGTAVTFSIDDVPVASGSSNISTGSAESFGWWVSVQKASGSENRGIAIDWYSLGLTRNEPR